MMPNKRLLGLVPEAMRYIILKVVLSWCSLAAGIVLWFSSFERLRILVVSFVSLVVSSMIT